jgi:phage shock protein C
MKKLYKSQNDRVLAGVLGGLSEYYEVDPLVVRLFFLFFIIITGFFPGVLFYIIAALLVPEKYSNHRKNVDNQAE